MKFPSNQIVSNRPANKRVVVKGSLAGFLRAFGERQTGGVYCLRRLNVWWCVCWCAHGKSCGFAEIPPYRFDERGHAVLQSFVLRVFVDFAKPVRFLW